MEVDEKEVKQYKKNGKHIAFDWGIKTFLVGYDGEKKFKVGFDKSKINTKKNKGLYDENINRKQKALSHRKMYSNKWKLAKTKLEQAYLKKENYQENLIKEVCSWIAERYDYVILEDLSMSFVMRNKRLARSAASHPYYKFKVTLFNKLKQSGKQVFLVPHSFPSTQMCSSCGNILKGNYKMKLGMSTYDCKECGKKIDRDKNAAVNLYNCLELTEFVGS